MQILSHYNNGLTKLRYMIYSYVQNMYTSFYADLIYFSEILYLVY